MKPEHMEWLRRIGSTAAEIELVLSVWRGLSDSEIDVRIEMADRILNAPDDAPITLRLCHDAPDSLFRRSKMH